jgi:hypothetical protein
MDAPTDLYKLTISSLDPTGHVNLLMNVKIISSLLSNRLTVYKKAPYLYPSGRRYEIITPFHDMNFSSSLLTPL